MSTMTTEHVLSARAASYVAAVGNGIGVAHVGWTSTVKPAAAHKTVALTKTVTATVLTGVNYADLAVNEGRETGDLPWGEWIAAPHVIGHRGTEYARLNVVDGTVTATYAVDGTIVPKAEYDADGNLTGGFDSYLTPSARKPSQTVGGTITVKMANLTILS